MFNNNGGYSLSDIAAVTGRNGNDDGWGGNSGWWIIIFIIFAMFGWGGEGYGGWGNRGGGSGAQGALTRADLCSEFSFNDLQGGVRGLEQGICSLGYDQLAQMNGINSNISAGFAGVNAGITGLGSNLSNAICTLGYQTQAQFGNLGTQLL